MIDVYLSINKYNKVNVVKKKDATYSLLVRLIMMNPGTIQSHPRAGVGLIRNWRYMDTEDKIMDLQLEISKQIQTYLPQLQGVDVKVEQDKKMDGRINFFITVNEKIYVFSENNGKIVDYIEE